MASLNRRAGLAGEAVPERIDVIAKVTAECWNGETEEFRQDCELAMEREYQQALKGWEASLSDTPTRLAEEIAATFTNAAFYLQPFVDAIQQRFGMCATVLLAGPIGERDGKIGVQSVNAGKTRGLSAVDWPTFDWQGFSAVEACMINFARECFSGMSSTSSESMTGGVNIGVQICERQRGAKRLLAGAQTTSTLERGSANVEEGGGGEGDEGDEREERDAQNEGGRARETATMVLVESSGHMTSFGSVTTAPIGRRSLRARTRRLRLEGVGERSGGGCVQKFFDFEAAWGYDEGSWKMATKVRPRQVTGWLNRGRKWTLPPALGGLLGSREATGQAEELWVGLFWTWWRTLQPDERQELANRELSRPEKAD
ncbi:hypothetical protein B0H14DRAFT_3484013 [Mycena olivaceomarginata]|nr:hypothetical protein B0H14DRAFT_3484013 [Mycena olivaceomarginata]